MLISQLSLSFSHSLSLQPRSQVYTHCSTYSTWHYCSSALHLELHSHSACWPSGLEGRYYTIPHYLQLPQVQNRITDQLSWAMEGGQPSPPHLCRGDIVERTSHYYIILYNAHLVDITAQCLQVTSLGEKISLSQAKSEDWVMFTQYQFSCQLFRRDRHGPTINALLYYNYCRGCTHTHTHTHTHTYT